jgi:hypothetical protein
VRTRGFGEADPLAPELIEGFDGRVGRDHDCLRVTATRLGCHVEKICSRRLGEDRRRIAGGSVVDAAGVEGFEQRRAEGELDPLDLNAERLEALLQQLLLLGDQEHATLLIADADLLRVLRGEGRAHSRRGGTDGRQRYQEPASGRHRSAPIRDRCKCRPRPGEDEAVTATEAVDRSARNEEFPQYIPPIAPARPACMPGVCDQLDSPLDGAARANLSTRDALRRLRSGADSCRSKLRLQPQLVRPPERQQLR